MNALASLHRTGLALGLTLALAAAGSPTSLAAQAALGPGEDAWNLPGGVMRFGIASRFFGASQQFGANGREPLGLAYNGILDNTRLSSLVGLESIVSELSATPGFRANLGVGRTNFATSGAVIPFELSVGVTSRITLRALVPYFTGQQEAQWLIDGSGANVGANPGLGAGGLNNSAIVSGLSDAATSLETLADGCAADAASDPRCTQIIGDMASVRALILNARTTSDAVAVAYGGRTGTTPAVVVPLAGSATQLAIAAQLALIRDAFSVYGTTSIGAGAVPAGAGAPATLAQLETLLADTAYGYALGPISRRYKQGVGDVDLGISMTVYDGIGRLDRWTRDTTKTGFAFRQTFGFTYRAPTGTPANPDDPLKLATGTGIRGLQFLSATDLLFTRRLWSSGIVRYTQRGSRDGIMRFPDGTGSPFIPLSRRRSARTTLGDQLEITAAPRWSINSQLAVGLRWTYTHEGASTVTELAPFTDAIPLALIAPALSAHEAGFGFSWSSVTAWHNHHARWPIEVSYEHAFTPVGTNVPKLSYDRLSMRFYASLWGK